MPQKFGSIINHIQANSKQPEPSIERGMTRYMWSDRYAYFINSISDDGKTIVIERPLRGRTDKNGMSESQSYSYARNPDAEPITLRFRYGAWWEVATCPDRIRRYHAMKSYNNPKYKPVKTVYWEKWSVGFHGMSEYFDYSF